MAEHNVYINIVVRTGQMTAGLKKAEVAMTGLNKTAGRIMRTMTAFAALFIARGLIQGIGNAIRSFAAFEKGIANIAILMGEEIGLLGSWETAVREVATGLGLASADLLKAGFDIQSATNDTVLSLEIFRESAKLAVAGGSDLKSTASGAITLNETYGKSFKSVADQMDFLIVAQKTARATIGELSQASSKFLGVAASLGITAEELFAVYSQATRGFGNAKDAATGMSAIMNSLQKPSGKMIQLSREQFGMSIQQAVATHGFIEVLKALKTVTIENIGTTLGRIRANRLFAIVRDDVNTIEKIAIELLEREGAVQEKLAIQMETTERRLARLSETWQSFNRTLGGILARDVFIDTLQDFVDTMDDFGKHTKRSKEEIDELISPLTRVKLTLIDIGRAMNLIETPTLGDLGLEDISIPDVSFSSLENALEFDEFGFIDGFETAKEQVLLGIGDIAAANEESNLIRNADFDSYISKQEVQLGKLRFLWEAFRNAQNVQVATNTQQELEMFKFKIETMKNSMKSLWSIAGKMRDTFSSGVSNMFTDMIKGTLDVQKSFIDLGISMVKILIDFTVQKLVNFALAQIMKGQELLALTAFGKMAAAALAPAAAMMSLITLGSNAASAIGGMAATVGAFMGAAVGLKEGGIVPGMGRGDRVPAMLEPGEAVIPRQQVKSFTDNSRGPSIQISMAGALIMDDPNAVEKLYREYLQDRIKQDIRTGRDVFYG